MATLVSPGVSITVTDESQYASAGPGTVPLIIIATASEKTSPDGIGIAPGTEVSGVMELVTSQRELIQKFGVPVFETLNGTVIQGSEVSEYGLHAAWSYMGIANRAFVLRADVNLNQLKFSQAAPRSEANNGTYWFDTGLTKFGIFRANGNATPGLAWDLVTPLIPSASQVDGSFIPLNGFGTDGDIAAVTLTTNNAAYEKISGAWYLIGSNAWKAARDTIATGTVVNPTFTISNTIIINGVTVTMTGTTLAQAIIDINANITLTAAGIAASNSSNRLRITDTNGLDITIAGSDAAAAGLSALYVGYHANYSTHVSIPAGSHTGDIWVKTTDPNDGASYVIKRYNSSTNQWSILSAPLYVNDAAADAAYGGSKTIGSLYVHYNTTGTLSNPIATHVIKRWDGSNWSILVYEASTVAPSNDPLEGTLWISDDLRVDIMVNDGNEWKGYLNAYPTTDPEGVIISSAEPTEQSDGTPLVQNDLWLDSNDTDNYPSLYRYNAGTQEWEAINKTDQTTPFGIVFADARGNDDGTDTGSELITDMLASDYVDADTPNPETYPADILLFNTRYSTYNVKEWMPDYFNGQGAYTVGAAAFGAPTYFARWITKSGNKVDGSPYMGRHAQHIVTVRSMAEAINANEDIRSEFIFFNLIAAPGYPELIDELQTLNIDRKETAFIITDTPMRLKPDGTSINNWATNSNESPSTDEFGRTTRYTYSAEYYPQALSTNIDGVEVVVPASTIALRTYAYNDSVAYPWFPPAGTRRGVINNAASVGFINDEGEYQPVTLSQGQRDVLYLNNINPLARLPGRGLLVYGDKTLHPEASALDRVNVARLIVYLRYQLEQLAQPFLFELNVKATRDAVQSVFSRYLGDLLSLNAVTDFVVVCDESNNTPDRIDRNELWIDIAIAPAKSINFIYIPIRVVRTNDPSLAG